MTFEREMEQPDFNAGTVVYAIEHQASGATYVGKSRNWTRRKGKHRSDLRNGLHHNAPLQALVTRDGLAALTFEVWWRGPAGTTDMSLSEAEDLAMAVVAKMNRPLLNVLRPATRAGRAFSIGPGGRWRRRAPAIQADSLFDLFGAP
jgi:GIY-YIG catalytic domain